MVGIFGATGTGKSYDIKAALDAQSPGRRVLIFDPGREYGAGQANEAAYYRTLNAGQLGRLIFWPSFNSELRERQFDRFCRCALAIARAAGDVLVVIDELHLVTQPGRAPPGWRELIETGRKFGAHVFAASIRPAAIDKSFWTNATHVTAHRLNFADDQKTLANCLGVAAEEIGQLAAHAAIARNLLTGETVRRA
jgi:DNA helicase HerA-like ATPase